MPCEGNCKYLVRYLVLLFITEDKMMMLPSYSLDCQLVGEMQAKGSSNNSHSPMNKIIASPSKCLGRKVISAVLNKNYLWN